MVDDSQWKEWFCASETWFIANHLRNLKFYLPSHRISPSFGRFSSSFGIGLTSWNDFNFALQKRFRMKTKHRDFWKGTSIFVLASKTKGLSNTFINFASRKGGQMVDFKFYSVQKRSNWESIQPQRKVKWFILKVKGMSNRNLWYLRLICCCYCDVSTSNKVRQRYSLLFSL